MRLVLPALLLACCVIAPAAQAEDLGDDDPSRTLFGSLQRDPSEFALVSDKPHVSFHKPTYLLPFTYSEAYPEEATEVVFQISLKQQLFKRNIYFAYTQQSFWQLYNGKESRPFRETDYNPELFLRWKQLAGDWGLDVGGDHQSNGKSLPDSRSWNRLYISPFHETDEQLVHFKVWWRLPEDQRSTPDDPHGDDNPDIDDYYGWGEVTLQRRIFVPDGIASLMARGNPTTGKGAVSFSYSAPFGDYAYWQLYAWHGYGESLGDYNQSVTRFGFGLALAR